MHVETASPFSQVERRQFRRTRTIIPALIGDRGVASKTPRDCVVLDLSVGGARIWMEGPPDDSSNIVLHTRRFGILDAEVVWRGSDRAGLRFRQEPAAVAKAMEGLLPQACLAG